jgi:hypothetical protein
MKVLWALPLLRLDMSPRPCKSFIPTFRINWYVA